MKIAIDGTNLEPLMTTINYNTIYNKSFPVIDSYNFYKGLYGHHKDYLLYFNCELNSIELNYIKDPINIINLGKIIFTDYENIGTSGELNSKWEKLIDTYNEINRQYLDVKIRKIGFTMYLYVNNNLVYLNEDCPFDITLKNLKFFGNS